MGGGVDENAEDLGWSAGSFGDYLFRILRICQNLHKQYLIYHEKPTSQNMQFEDAEKLCIPKQEDNKYSINFIIKIVFMKNSPKDQK